MKNIILKRQESNIALAGILTGTELETKYGLGTELSKLAERYPQQRAGQIITNYICADYRDEHPSEKTVEILGALFPGNPDPFFEESVETLKRIKNTLV